jgi:hypothetical protein
MDLNEKLAARRKELAVEAEKAKQAEQQALAEEVTRRLAKQGIDLPHREASPKAPELSKKAIDVEVEKELTKAASSRMTNQENGSFYFLSLLAIGGFFLQWWLGLIFTVWAIVYHSKAVKRHKEEIIAEGKRNLESKHKTDSPAYEPVTMIVKKDA